MSNFKFLLIVLTIIATKCHGQENAQNKIIGSWQADDNIVSSAYKKTITFYPRDSFKIKLSEYDELNRIISIHGTYKTLNDSVIVLTVLYRIERTGGYLVTGSPGFESSEFVLEGGTFEKINQNPKETGEPFKVKVYTDEQKRKTLDLNFKKYYYIDIK